MGLLGRLFSKKQSKGRSQKHQATESKAATPPGTRVHSYQPGQREPGEYHELYALKVKEYSGAREPKMVSIVGFDDRSALEKALDALCGQLSGVVREHRAFAARNPVAIIEYAAAVSGSVQGEKAMINDARLLHSNGASDITVIGVSMAGAEQLRNLFGKLSCVHLAIVAKK